MRAAILASLDDDKAEAVVVMSLAGKSSIADYLIIASGRSTRHVGAITEHLRERLKARGGAPRIEGVPQCNWVLVDADDIIVHVFQPEVRAFYNLEKLWSDESPADQATA